METTFSGRFVLDRPLTKEHREVLEEFWDEEHADENGQALFPLAIGVDGKPANLYCQWMPSEDGLGLEWDGVEKFRNYVAWLEYLVSHFIQPWGYVLSGAVTWESLYEPELGTLFVQDNQVFAVPEPPRAG